MFPILIDLGTFDLPFLGETPIFLPTYGLLFASSVIVAAWWFIRRARTLGIDDDSLFNLVFYTLIGGILGAKLLLIVVDWKVYLANPSLIWGTLRSAGVLVGGVILGALSFIYYSYRKGMPTWALGDALAAPLALAQGIGRLGCFAAGCCWGKETHADHPLAVVFTHPAAATYTGVTLNRPLIAVQLIQMIADLALAVVLTVLWHRRPRPAGTVFWVYVFVYSITRGIVEFWRGDTSRGLYLDGFISTSQIFSIFGLVLAGMMLLRAHKLRRQRDAATAA